MSIPKIFVGTLYSGEGDYVKCIEAINEQTSVLITHTVINRLPEREAHNALWQQWNVIKENYDLFVKIDADTVLCHGNVLSDIWELFVKNNRVTGVQAPLHDYMTDELINGLNCFSPRVKFNRTTDELFCDRNVDTCHDVVLRKQDLPQSMIPAGYHCHYSSEVQAFHYGFHRALKKQSLQLEKVLEQWKIYGDKLRGLALIGAAKSKSMNTHNYTDNQFQKCFDSVISNYEDNIKLLELQ